MINAITIDVEDWYHVCGLRNEPVVAPHDCRVLSATGKILELLARYDVKATFFVLGSVAEQEPSLVPMIAAAGHEVASHGWSHVLLTELDPVRFTEEVRLTATLLERQSGVWPVGFRAPQWSLGRATAWAFPILAAEGYRYDSSLNPLPFVGDRRGPRTPFSVATRQGKLWEIPPMVTRSPIGNLPTGGGWGFRVFPLQVIERTIRSMNKQETPAVLYLHPREIETDGPRLRLSPLRSFAAYGPRNSAAWRLEYLLDRFRFGTLHQVVSQWESA